MAPPKPGNPIRRRILIALAAGLASLLLLDLALGLWVLEDGRLGDRPLPPFGPITHPLQRDWLVFQRSELELPPERRGPGVFDRELGWTHRPGFASPDGRYRFNSLAARGGREYAPQAPAGVTRAVCFGDSFTHCDQVDDAGTWQSQLEALEPRLEVLNFGVGGYGTDQALLRFRRDGGALDADVVWIGMLLENVGRNVNRYRPLWYPRSRSTGAKPRFVLEEERLRVVSLPLESRQELLDAVEDGSILAALAEHEHWSGPHLGPLRRSALARLGAGYLAYRARDPRRLWLDLDGEPARVTLEILRTFHREALASGASHAAVLLFPREKDLIGLIDRDDRYWSGLRRALADSGVPCVDLCDDLVEPYRAARRGERPPIYAGGHLGPAANGVVAARLHALWRELSGGPGNAGEPVRGGG